MKYTARPSKRSPFVLVSALALGSLLLPMSSFASVLPASSLQSSVQYNDEEGSSADEVSGLANTADLNGLGEKVFNRLFDVQDSVVMQAHGFYSKGTLKDASNFELEGAGFIKILRPRDRGYATVDLIHVISTASAQLHSDFPDGERLQIGDVAGHLGGQLARHASHQNGLDSDVVYFRNIHEVQDPTDGSGFKEIFVINDKISKNFDAKRNWRFVNHLDQTGRLVRIFMDPIIKRELCDYSKKIGEYDAQGIEVLRHIRPYPLHRDHMHVRISCPEGDTACVSQQEVPPGSGCDAVEHAHSTGGDGPSELELD